MQRYVATYDSLIIFIQESTAMEYVINSDRDQEANNCWARNDHAAHVAVLANTLQDLGVEVVIESNEGSTNIYIHRPPYLYNHGWKVVILAKCDRPSYYIYYQHNIIAKVHNLAAVVAMVTTTVTFK